LKQILWHLKSNSRQFWSISRQFWSIDALLQLIEDSCIQHTSTYFTSANAYTEFKVYEYWVYLCRIIFNYHVHLMIVKISPPNFFLTLSWKIIIQNSYQKSFQLPSNFLLSSPIISLTTCAHVSDTHIKFSVQPWKTLDATNMTS
jgi:hypothetical protein